MASVYKAQHVSLGRNTAIKILHPEFISDKNLINLFRQEAKILATLNHPNIVQIYDFDYKNGDLYIVMEYIKGVSLDNLLLHLQSTEKPMPISQCVKIVQSIGNALSFAHNQKVIHRDIKPTNVLVEDSGRIVLADFGLSKIITGNTEFITSSLTGTPAYLAPEQFMGNPVRETTDIYSLGVLFFELATGKLPYKDTNISSFVNMDPDEPAPRPRDISTRVPKKVEDIIIKAMQKNIAKRYANIDEMLKDIKRLKEAKTEQFPTATLSKAARPFFGKSAQPKETNFRATLHFMDSGQIMELPEGKEFVFGRINKFSSKPVDIDLTPFHGIEKGISRKHAKLLISNGAIHIMDLKSMNGTWFEGIKLDPNIPKEIFHTDVFNIGQIKIQILVYEDYDQEKEE